MLYGLDGGGKEEAFFKRDLINSLVQSPFMLSLFVTLYTARSNIIIIIIIVIYFSSPLRSPLRPAGSRDRSLPQEPQDQSLSGVRCHQQDLLLLRPAAGPRRRLCQASKRGQGVGRGKLCTPHWKLEGSLLLCKNIVFSIITVFT